MADSVIRCSFCGRQETEVWRLIAGPGVYICSDCIGASIQILSSEGADAASRVFRFATRRPDGLVQQSEYGPLPEADPGEPVRNRWLKQCVTCGTWNAGVALADCLHCGSKLS
ncbi:MAG: ClpX C4-type zinc finger protein [Mycobacterium leprae]